MKGFSKENLSFSVDTVVFDTVFTTVGSTSQQITRTKTEQAGIPTKQISTGTVEARHTTNPIHISSGQFRSEVHQQRGCTTPATST